VGTRIRIHEWPAVERATLRWLRHGVTRRSNRLAARAIDAVLHESLRCVGAMARRRETMCDEVFPGHDYHQQIVELTTLCVTLLPGLGPSGRPGETLKSTWDSRSVPGRQWIRRCLAAHDIALDDIIQT
jgi:Mg2+ and Co2+ transporter CorA